MSEAARRRSPTRADAAGIRGRAIGRSTHSRAETDGRGNVTTAGTMGLR